MRKKINGELGKLESMGFIQSTSKASTPKHPPAGRASGQKNSNSHLKNLIKAGATVVISVLIIFTVVKAGTLTPSTSPAATSYTLSDIYTRLTTNVTSTEGNHIFAPAATPTSTLNTLTQIYNAIPTIDAAKILSITSYLGVIGTYNASDISVGTVKSGTAFGVGLIGVYPSSTYPLPSADATITDLAASGGNIASSNDAVEWWQSDGTRQTATLDFPTLSNICSTDTSNNSTGTLSVTAAYIAIGNTYCGAAGTLLANLFNGTGAGVAGGSQANGGIDDYYSGVWIPPADRYSKGWTACNIGNNYCGTGLSSADAKDDSTGLIWSLPCEGTGCDSFSDTAPLVYSWDNSASFNWSTVQNATSTAPGLCTNGDHQQTGWSLPHQRQLMQAYIDGSYGNLEALYIQRFYWSATTSAGDTASVWETNLSFGDTGTDSKVTVTNVRCVRSAP